MSLILPINIDNLLHHQGVESARVEFKSRWDEKTTGYQVLKTICAFANDLCNLNGGYIVIGVEEQGGTAILPPKGIDAKEIEAIQKWLRGHCNQIDPVHQPVFSPEIINDKHILVIWVPASENRPHTAPDGQKGQRKFFVRIGSETVDAEKNGVLPQLNQLTARVPFDDRRALQAKIEDMRETRVREFLRDIDSGLLEENNTRELYRKLRIAFPCNGYDVPKNIGLLCFSENPENWFRGAHIEIVQFAGDASGDILEEKYFFGGIHEQLKNAIAYLETILSTHIHKQPDSLFAKRWVSYPDLALREALGNAIYHCSYENNPEPIKVYLYPDRMEIISYPGPVPGIEKEHLLQRAAMPPVPARNRRIGEFLKDLKLAEGRGTGLGKLYKSMKSNGSRTPLFDFDSERTYFRVTLPAHPEYVAISSLRDAAYLKAIGNDTDAFERIKQTWVNMKDSPSLTAELIRLSGSNGNVSDAKAVYESFAKIAPEALLPFVTNILIDVLLHAGFDSEAHQYFDKISQYTANKDAIDSAILARRLGSETKAHRYFENAGEALFYDTKAMHEFAQTKIKLAQKAYHDKKNRQRENTNKRFLNEARELLERITRMEADTARHAWCWRDLGRVKKYLKFPVNEIESAYHNAINLLPQENRFQQELKKIRKAK